MKTLSSLLALRLLWPAAGLIAIVAMGEPLPEPHADPMQAVSEEIAHTAERVRMEAERVREESRDAAERARASAAAMRWIITLPAASSRRCVLDTCADA